MNRQVLAMHYIFNELGVKGVDATIKARFIQFLTKRELGAKTIKDTNIYKCLQSPLKQKENELKKDLIFVRDEFEKLNLSNITNKILNELNI